MPKPLRVLIVEDSADDTLLVLRELRRGGYEPVHERVDTAAAMQAALDQGGWDLVICDHAMPQFGSGAALKLVQERRLGIPFLIVSGRIGEDVAVAAMKAGAHDYIMKGNLTRLVPAVQRELREVEVRRQKRRAEKALLESEEMFRSLSTSSPVGILLTDLQGYCTYGNPRCRVLTGLSLVESMGHGWERAIHPEDREQVKQGWYACAGQGRDYDQEFRMQTPTGLVRWVFVRAAVMRSETDDRPTGYVMTIEDISERKQAEEQVRQSNRELADALVKLQMAQDQMLQQERLRALGQMASGIAHDFNNALSVVLGLSELLLKHPERFPDRETVLRPLQLIHTAGRDASQVVHRLREFYRHREAGEVFVPLHLNQIVEQAVALSQPRWKEQAQANGITIHVATNLSDIPAIYGNEAELREALLNLIFNTVDAMPAGGTLTISTRLEDAAPAAESRTPSSPSPGAARVTLAVADTGTGMTEEVRQHCLEPFYTTKGERGSGLGLSMVLGIFQRHEGALDIASAPGQGTTFTVRFPIQTGPVPAWRAPDETLLAPLSILVVEDEPTLLEVLAELLASDHHSVRAVATGAEAVDWLRRARFDLVITDRSMPGMSGDQVAAAVKRFSPQMPVILLTGFGEIMQATGEQPAGVDHIVSKPVTLSQLRQAIAGVIHQTRTAPKP
ncbi:response regulator [bacterium]|nr:response regulator [bacterium]